MAKHVHVVLSSILYGIHRLKHKEVITREKCQHNLIKAAFGTCLRPNVIARNTLFGSNSGIFFSLFQSMATVLSQFLFLVLRTKVMLCLEKI